MDRLDAMRAFVATVDHGSLAAAGRRLGHSAASVTRAVALLEARLGMQLLHRNTRALHLTPFGDTYLATCRNVLDTLDTAERGAEAEQTKPTGLLTLTAPLMFGTLHVRPVLDAFLDANPAVQARLLLLDRVVHLVEEGIELAVRLAHLPDSELLAIRLGEVRRVVCAAPTYLARHGTPSSPAELREHACIVENNAADADTWRFAPGSDRAERPALSVQLRPRLMLNSAAAAIDSAIAGHGITRVMSYQAATAVAAGHLIVLLQRHEVPPLPVHLVQPPGRTATAKLRAFLDFAAPRLRSNLLQASRDIGETR
ncbi:LysR family transcriptional regulator [Acidisphaera sp. L21]|uniref:LysR family transcriptional regulator n=1 Tax=Acidisphaera sp. L21 TaxID=1641851 RepID=UPI00131D7ADB|nr:LysR family transcriptional regulator [Acidisphaera sp. L21]